VTKDPSEMKTQGPSEKSCIFILRFNEEWAVKKCDWTKGPEEIVINGVEGDLSKACLFRFFLATGCSNTSSRHRVRPVSLEDLLSFIVCFWGEESQFLQLTSE
jgi:hypothetical protein